MKTGLQSFENSHPQYTNIAILNLEHWQMFFKVNNEDNQR